MDQTENTGGAEPVTPVAPVTPTATPAPVEPKMTFDQKDVEENKLIAALAYLGLLFLVPLLVKKESPFAQFHAKQGLVLCIAFFVFNFIPVFGWIVNVALFIVNIIALVKTLSGETWEIPLVKDVVKKLNI